MPQNKVNGVGGEKENGAAGEARAAPAESVAASASFSGDAPSRSEPAGAASSQRVRWLPPDSKPASWRARHRSKLHAAEWAATAVFTLIALYLLWCILFVTPPPPLTATRPPSREEFRERLRAEPIGDAPVPTEWDIPARVGRWRGIVVHHTATEAGNPESIDRFHRVNKEWENGLGYHFLIGNGHGMADGEVAVSRRWRDQETLDGAHVNLSEAAKSGVFNLPADAKGNAVTIGVALVGNFENDLPTASQLTSLKRLLTFLRKRYGIGLATIVGHGEVAAKGTACPGRWLLVDEVVLALANP